MSHHGGFLHIMKTNTLVGTTLFPPRQSPLGIVILVSILITPGLGRQLIMTRESKGMEPFLILLIPYISESDFVGTVL